MDRDDPEALQAKIRTLEAELRAAQKRHEARSTVTPVQQVQPG